MKHVGENREDGPDVMRAGESPPIFLTDTNRKGSLPDSVAACMERETRHPYGVAHHHKC